jgi:hypothetical protein
VVAEPVLIVSKIKLPVENAVNVFCNDSVLVITDAVNGLSTLNFLLVKKDCMDAV